MSWVGDWTPYSRNKERFPKDAIKMQEILRKGYSVKREIKSGRVSLDNLEISISLCILMATDMATMVPKMCWNDFL